MTDLKQTGGDGAVRIQIEAFGVYWARVKGTLSRSEMAAGFQNEIAAISLLTQTDRIPLRKGVHFGVTIVASGQRGGQFVTVRQINRFPSPGVTNPKTGKAHLYEELIKQFELGKREIVSYSFDEDCEMLPGEWKFEFWDGEQKLAEKTLVVETVGEEEAHTVSTRDANLARWKSSPEPEGWVRKHLQGWNHNDWLKLLESLRLSLFWPMDESAVGKHLEMLRNTLQTTEAPGAVRPRAAASAPSGSKNAPAVLSSSSSAEHSETVAILINSAVPTLYQHNGFRVLDLPADATAREISRRKQTVEKALNHDVPVPPGPGRYFPLTPPPDQFAAREAMQRLSEPERRLIDELFWFWPHHQGQAANDVALSRLRDGKDKEAEGLWLEQEADHSESSVCTHNLALLYHFRAIEQELELLRAVPGAIEVNGLVKVWDKSFRRWRTLSEQEDFWSRLTSRIRELEDPRLTAGTGRRIRSALPSALLSICGQLVLQAVEAGRKDSASRLVEVITKSGFSEADVTGGLRTAIDPVRQRIKTLCKAAELASKNDPAHADQACRQLLTNAKPLLDGMDCLLPGNHPTRELAHDDVAERALSCQVAFAKKTDNWKLSVSLLEMASAFAASESVRKRLQENIERVRKNAETNDDFCGDGYYDAPAALLEQMENARQMADRQNHDQAIECLEGLLAGKAEVRVSVEHVGLVTKALAYCLGCRAAARMNEAIDKFNGAESSVISDIQGRAQRISDASWRCAAMETIPPYMSCPCMACGTVISGRYTVLKWTFNEEKGQVTLIVCGNCGDRHRSQLANARTKLKEVARQCAQDYVNAGQLDAANKFVQRQIERMRKTCADLEVAFPSPRRGKPKLGKEASQASAGVPTLPQGQSSTISRLATTSRVLAFLSFVFGILTAIPAVIYGHRALAEIDRSGGALSGRNRANTGLAIGYSVIAFWVVVLLIALANN